MAKVRISSRVTDSDPGRPVAQALRELASLANDHADQIPALAARIDQLATRQLTLTQISAALSPTGPLPLNPSAPGGSATGSGSGALKYGPHAARLSVTASDGMIWYETDRALTYQYHAGSGWRYVCGIMVVSLLSDNPLPPGSDDGSGGGVDLPADSSDGGDTAAGVAAAGSDGHPAGSYDGTALRAGKIIGGVANEYPALVAAASDDADRDAKAAELLSRIIWHLLQDGYTAGKQRNPSGIISGDKIAIVEAGTTRAFDIFTWSAYSNPITVQGLQVSPANLVPDPGIAD